MKCTIEPIEERPQRWILLLDGSLCRWQDQEKRAYPLPNPYDPFLIASQITSNKVSLSNTVHFWKRHSSGDPCLILSCLNYCAIRSPQIMAVVGKLHYVVTKRWNRFNSLPFQCCSQSRHSMSVSSKLSFNPNADFLENYFKSHMCSNEINLCCLLPMAVLSILNWRL